MERKQSFFTKMTLFFLKHKFQKSKTKPIGNRRNRFDVVIAEGLFAFYDYSINQLYDRKFHVKISKRTFLIRRAMDIRWGYEPTWFIDHVWLSFLKYGKPRKDLKGIVNVSGEDEFDMDKVIKSLDFARLS